MEIKSGQTEMQTIPATSIRGSREISERADKSIKDKNILYNSGLVQYSTQSPNK